MGQAKRRKKEIAEGNFKGKSKEKRTMKIRFWRLDKNTQKLTTREINALYQAEKKQAEAEMRGETPKRSTLKKSPSPYVNPARLVRK